MTEYLYCIRSKVAGVGIAKIGVASNVRTRFSKAEKLFRLIGIERRRDEGGRG